MKNFIGQQLGNYRLLQLLGQGGFAEVYLGEHVRLGMKAAIKILHTHLAGDEINAFQQEARIIADLKHPHIVRVLDFDVHQGIPFLVLDYASHGSLRQKHPVGTALPAHLVAEYVTQVASALQYAHDKKLIHRDIKPENMLIGDQEEILLSDFGIATFAHATSSMSTQNSLGTLAYMSPEQIQGKPRAQSDQYALAVTAYHWLSGVFPFRGSSAELLAQHLAVEPPSLRSKASHVSADVEKVIMKALAKDPHQRFDSIQTFATELAQACGKSATHRSDSSANAPTVPEIEPGNKVVAPVSAPSPLPVTQQAAPNTPPSPEQYKVAQTPRVYTPPPQPLRAAPQQRKKNAWGIWLIGTLIITVLGIIALLVIPQMVVYGPKGSSSYTGQNSINDYTPYIPPPDYSATSTADAQATVYAAKAAVDISKPYVAEQPGPDCDKGGSDWGQGEGQPPICPGDGTVLSAPAHDFDTIYFYWIKDFPQKFTASVDVSQIPANQGCFMFYIGVKDILSSRTQVSGLEVCPPEVDIACCSSPISDTVDKVPLDKSAFTLKIARSDSTIEFYLDDGLVYTGTIDPSVIFQEVEFNAFEMSITLKHFVFTPLS